jgi:DNA-binding transcriptional LysR family regulator
LVKQFEPNDLLIFARVADAGSFSRAAERLGLPKSTVSRRISLLEDRLGERLMVRTTRRLRLTELGERLLEHARRVAIEVEDVAALALFLCTESARHIQGTAIAVDGGATVGYY